MLPKPPPRQGALGFLYLPPYRVQGYSVAGEATVVQAPELDLCFDMGFCPRAALASKVVAISHGHMDHIGALAYYCSQRVFQGMGPGTLICDARIAPAVKRMLDGYIDLEKQVTPYEVIALEPEQEYEIKNNIVVRGFPVEHGAPAFGYSVIEKRSKLKPEFVGFPQEKLRELKSRGVDITRVIEIPIMAYLGDTTPCAQLVREDVRTAPIVISECTFIDPDHRSRAKIGNHMHVEDIAEWLPVLECEALVLTHLSRRNTVAQAKVELVKAAGKERSKKVFFLMDHRANRAHYEHQLEIANKACEANKAMTSEG